MNQDVLFGLFQIVFIEISILITVHLNHSSIRFITVLDSIPILNILKLLLLFYLLFEREVHD